MDTGPPTALAIRSSWRFYRDALALWLARQADLRLAGKVGTDEDLLDLCRLRPPDVVLFDADGASLGALHELRARFPEVGVVVLCERPCDADVHGAARVPYSQGLRTLLKVIRQEADEVRAAGGRVAPGPDELTDEEWEVITLLAAGHPVHRIAELLAVAPGVIESAKRRIFHKLRVLGQNQAVARATALGLVEPADLPATASPGSPPLALTPRETDILRSIAMGHTVRQTARLLDIAAKTVENTQARLFLKLGARNRAGAIAAAHVLGLLDSDPLPAGRTHPQG
jgi:DNA-binding NarL/FixJ family response regulator